jgi:hypothetical protein
MEDYEWRTASGGLRVEDFEWRTTSGGLREHSQYKTFYLH